MSGRSVNVRVNSENVKYTDTTIISNYEYHNSHVVKDGSNYVVTPTTDHFVFETKTDVPKVGLMLVGWGGNNGSTTTASLLANQRKLSWETREGKQESNYYGSLTQASTISLGLGPDGHEVYVPLNSIVPFADLNDFEIGGWDISNLNIADSCARAGVLHINLQRQLEKDLAKMTPLPSPYYPDFIAANQKDRANNVMPGTDKQVHLDTIRKDIRDFAAAKKCKPIVVWTANTERFADILPGVNDTADNLLNAIKTSHDEVSPSTLFAVACILEGVPFINGSPQNTFVPGCVQLAERENSMIAGDDFKSGQTKIKSVLVDFLVNAGIKPLSIASYNHLGNNDGKNLSSHKQFRSKEISKSNVVDDMVAANPILYADGEHPDHIVVIKYVPTVGDSKRALDEYVNEIFMGGKNVISLHNTCEDSLLATPLIFDLALMAELMTRITYSHNNSEPAPFHPVLSLLSYLLKAPLVKKGTPVINSLIKQRASIENVLRALVGLQPNHSMMLEHKLDMQPSKKQLSEE